MPTPQAVPIGATCGQALDVGQLGTLRSIGNRPLVVANKGHPGNNSVTLAL